MSEQAQQGGSFPAVFDDKPIGKQHKFDIPEYAENEDPTLVVENAPPAPRPLGERLKKAIIKTKKEALEELLDLVKNDPCQFEAFASLTLDFLSFRDMVVQDLGLKVLIHYISAGKEPDLNIKSLIKVLIEKCLCLEKEEIKHNAQQVLYWCMQNSHEQLLLCELNDYLISKNRKTIATVILFIANLVHNYGFKRMAGCQRFSKNLQYISTQAKPIAKNQSIKLFKELFKWGGDSIFQDFKMHPEVKDQVMRFAKDYEKVPMEIKRGIPKAQQKINGQPVYQMQEQVQNTEPVDVLSSFSSQWVDGLMKIQKWKQKKCALEEFIKKIRVPCILPPRENSHFIFLIKKLLNDKNINLCYCGFHIIEHMSLGLKKDFYLIAKNILSDVYFKLKDLKLSTVELTQKALKCMLQALTFEDFSETMKEALNDKSPQIKEETMKFMGNFFPRKEPKILNGIRSFLDKIIQLTEDGSAKVRTIALQSLITLKSYHGMKLFGDKINKLDPKKLQTLQLAKSPPKQEEKIDIAGQMRMEIQQIKTKVAPSSKSNLPAREKPSKAMQIQYPNPQPNIPVVGKMPILKNDQGSSVNSTDNLKVARSLNLNCLQEISSPNENIRAQAYNTLSSKFLSKDIRQFLSQIKANSLKESSPNILKYIIQIAKKHIVSGIIQGQLAEFLVKHDWKRSKQIIQDFIMNNKITPEAEEIIKFANIIPNKPSSSGPGSTFTNSFSLKNFNNQLQNFLLSKMSSPIDSVKKEAAEYSISFWENMPKFNSQSQFTPANGWNQEFFTKLFNVVKCRLSDSNPEIVALYCRFLSEMIKKGVTLKHKNLKLIVNIVYSSMSKGVAQTKSLFRELVEINPSHMFTSMQSQIFIQSSMPAIVQFIVQNSDLFIKYADFKAFMGPMLNILCISNIEMKLKNGLDSVFNQMVQISGESVLEKEVNKLKIDNIQAYNQYLSKYGVCVNKNSKSNTGLNFRNKQDRLIYWQDEQWNLDITSHHILKLVSMMGTFPEPINSLCTVFLLTRKQIDTLNSMEFGALPEYSDILFKYIYWRTQIDPLPMVEQLLKFTCKLILATNYSITEIDVIVLLKALLTSIQRFKNALRQDIIDVLKRLFSINNVDLQNNTLQFWLNHLSSCTPETTNEILNIFMVCYENSLADSLVQLARISSVHRNEAFIKFLQHKFQSQHLTASGFRLAEGHKQTKALLSDQGGPENVVNMESSQMCAIQDMFMQNSEKLLINLREMSKLQSSVRAQQYVKILYSIIKPFYNGQIQIINMFSFLRELQKVLGEPYESKKGQIRQFTRILLYLLIDLDENPPNGTKCEEIIKMVNKCILTLMETSDSRHMMEVLFLMVRRQLELQLSNKLIHLIIKCLIKTAKAPDFRNLLTDNLQMVLTQTNSIFHTFQLQVDSPFLKTFRNLYHELIKHYPLAQGIIHQQLSEGTLHPTIQLLVQDFSAKEQPQGEQEPLKDHAVNALRTLSPGILSKVMGVKPDPQIDHL